MNRNSGIAFSAEYDAWGKRTVKRNALGLRRGYCQHEHWDEFDLIDMNGRMYDPIVGRFLSPDPYVQNATNPQNFNRYSYCLNNPLKYTDPTGEVFVLDDIIVAAVFGAIMNVAMQGYKGNINGNRDFVKYMFIGAVGGAAGGVAGQALGGVFSASSFLHGAAVGGLGGAVSGTVTETSNALANKASWWEALWKGFIAGNIGAGIGGVVGGIFGGIDAYQGNRNVWTGKSIATGRSPFAIHNTPLESNVYITNHPNGYELIDNIERNSNRWVHKYDDYNHYHGDDNPMTGNFARRDNRILPGQSMTRSLAPLKGEANVTFSGLIPQGTSVDVLYDGVVVHSFGSTLSPMEYVTTIPSYVREITVIYNGTPLNVFHSVQPFNTTITGFRP